MNHADALRAVQHIYVLTITDCAVLRTLSTDRFTGTDRNGTENSKPTCAKLCRACARYNLFCRDNSIRIIEQ